MLLSSDNPADQVGSFFAQFLLTPVGGPPASPLLFRGIQGETQLADPNYLFAGNSGLMSLSTPVTSIAGGDLYLSNLEFTTGPSISGPFSNALLFRLDLAAFDPGDYYITLVTAEFRPDALGEKSPLDFTSTPRRLSVQSPIGQPALPEQTSWLTWVGTGLSGIFMLRRRGRGQEIRSASPASGRG